MKRQAAAQMVVVPVEELKAMLLEVAIQIQQAQRATMTTRELCAWLKISRSTWSRWCAEDAALSDLGLTLDDDGRARWRADEVWAHLQKRGVKR